MQNRNKTLVLGATMTLMLAGCGSGPSDTAEEFLDHFANGEVEKAKQLATESTAGLLALAAGFGGLDVDPDFDFELVDESIDGNRATITYRNGSDGKIETLDLVKLDGEWKVHEEKG